MRLTAVLTLALLAGLLSVPDRAAAQDEPRISSLSALDRDFMNQQRKRIDDLARFHFGKQIRGEKANDLDILQTLLDRRLVRPEQTLELQAMGVIIGDLLAEELDMKWVAYEDKLGRSRALRYGRSDNFLFPITMISRRAEVGSTVDVSAVYDKAVSLIEPYRTPLPFR